MYVSSNSCYKLLQGSRIPFSMNKNTMCKFILIQHHLLLQPTSEEQHALNEEIQWEKGWEFKLRAQELWDYWNICCHCAK